MHQGIIRASSNYIRFICARISSNNNNLHLLNENMMIEQIFLNNSINKSKYEFIDL